MTSTTTVTSPSNTWAVTALEHPAVRDLRPACDDCLALVDSAIAHAGVTGSRGATFSDDRNGGHFVTVARVHALVDTTV